MRCEEARRLIGTGNGALDKSLREHIEECSGCARYAEAARVMEHLIDEAKKPEPVISFSAVRDRVNMNAEQQSTWEKIMSQIKDQYQTRPRIMAGMGLAIAVLCFMVLVPFSVDQTVGWKISMDGIDAQAMPSPEIMNAAFAAAGLDDVYVESRFDDDSNGKIKDIYVNTPSHEEARQLARAIVASASAEAVQVNIEPVVRIKSQTLIAQVYDRVKVEEDPPIRIRFEEGLLLINGQGIFDFLRSPELSDEAVRDKLIRILKVEDDDDSGVSVKVSTDYDDMVRIVEIKAPSASLSHALSDIELHASDKYFGITSKGDIDIPDSMAVVKLTHPDSLEAIGTEGIKMQIVIDLDEE
jgi:hypothetical protein